MMVPGGLCSGTSIHAVLNQLKQLCFKMGFSLVSRVLGLWESKSIDSRVRIPVPP